jgi:4-methylaminobutanoate oxidase (formaldehyde-forming)
LRIEKAYRHWSHDITDEDTPIEAGLEFAVKFDKAGGFVGREALLAQKESGVSKRLLQFLLRDPEPLIYHNEPVWRDGKLVGHITSGAYGHSLGGCIGLGYVEVDPGTVTSDMQAGDFEIEVAGVRVPAEASLRPLYDPRNERIRC